MASIFNSAIGAAAIGAAWEVGLLDAIRDHGSVNVDKFSMRHDLDRDSMQGLVTSLVIVKVVSRIGDQVVAGELLDETYRTKSLFHWLCLGSGELFAKMQ